MNGWYLILKGEFDSVDRTTLFNVLERKGVPLKCVNILRALYAHTTEKVRVYGQLCQSFDTSSGLRQGCSISPFLFNFVMDEVMRTALAEHETAGVDLVMGERLCNLEYADDVVCLFDTAESAQLILDRLARAVIPFGMCFAPSKCQVMYQDWDSPEPPLTLNGVRLDVVDHFTYLGSCLSKDGSIGSEINARISKARMAFANLLHLWRRNDVSLPVRGRVYNAAVRSVLLYGCETWPLRQQDVHRLEVLDHRCLRQLAKVGWSDRVSNLGVKVCTWGKRKEYTFQENKITQITKARSCVTYGTSSLTTSGPVFNCTDKVEEASRRPTNDVATWDEECYGWFEQSGIAVFTCLEPKRLLN